MTISARRAGVMIAAAALALLLFPSKKIFGAPPPSDSLDATPSRFATYDGARVHYKSFGEPAAKTAVVFVHGWSCDMTSWRAQLPAFEGRARVLLVDLPGHGKSDRPDVDYTMERFANAVEAVMRDAGVERALLVGHSMGTPVIRLFARLYPRKTIGLVAVDGALRTHTTDPEAIRKFTSSFAASKFRESLEGFFEIVLTPTTPENVKTEVRAMMRSASPHVAESAMKGMFDPAVWTDDPIGVPLQVIVAKSPMWNADYFAYVKTLNPSAEIHEVPDSGHFVMMEKPTEVNALLLAFASKTGVVPMRAVRPARPEDVSSREAIVNAVYDVISGPAGKARDWDRFRSLFAEGARLIPTGARPAGDFGPRVLDPEAYIARATPIFEKEGFHESEVARRTELFGHIAHVFSTYESRHARSDPKPFARGINSFQLAFDGTRWWVVTIFWEAESETVVIPEKYLR
jgi:pimeloyl-ACP methyl ester carboxylesterase